jgi:cell fate regulator YaaT (PSP1 superfamily)
MSGCSGCSFKGMSTAVEDTFVGVRFREETNLTLCGTGGRIYARGEKVVVDLEAGPTLGHVEQSPMPVFKPCQKSSARPVLRPADENDLSAHDRQLQNEHSGKLFAQEKSRALNLDMKISEGRVDFRQLVRDLSSRFSVRVKMVQVGARDEAGLVGGIGICGRTLCCSTWLKDFRPISIQMAKRQNLSLNPSKISGQCGRLLCCLAYEDEGYKKGNPDTRSAAPATA